MVDVLAVVVLAVDELEDVVDELLPVVEPFPGEVASSAKAETATTATTAIARTATRFTSRGKLLFALKRSQAFRSYSEANQEPN